MTSKAKKNFHIKRRKSIDRSIKMKRHAISSTTTTVTLGIKHIVYFFVLYCKYYLLYRSRSPRYKYILFCFVFFFCFFSFHISFPFCFFLDFFTYYKQNLYKKGENKNRRTNNEQTNETINDDDFFFFFFPLHFCCFPLHKQYYYHYIINIHLEKREREK